MPENVRLATRLFENTLEGIMITDAAGIIESVNPAFCRLTGYGPEEVTGRNANILSAGRETPAFYEGMWAALNRHGVWQGEMWNRRRDGEVFLKMMTITGIKEDPAAAGFTHFAAVFNDLSCNEDQTRRLHYLANHDPLTSLGNRAHFRERGRARTADAAKDGGHLALLLINLDRFRNINDTLGYAAGDTVLQDVARRLQQAGAASTSDLARLGGDEFGLLLRYEHQHLVHQYARTILESLAAPFTVEDREIYIATSIGIALFGVDGTDEEALEQAADLALGQAKERGGNTYTFHAAGMDARMRRRLTLETRLRRALSRDEFLLHYQPKVDLNTMEVTGMEALVRWNSPDQGLVSPDAFLPTVEDIGMMPALGEWVLYEACRQTRAWQKQGLPPVRVAVNLSPTQFTDGRALFDRIDGVLRDTGLPPFHLELEVTESVAMRNADAACRTMELLAGLGLRVALDDFGTGYSSLNYLRRFPISVLKIDKSFVDDMTASRTRLAIPAAVISMAHALNLEVVAEGISTPVQLELLHGLDCETGQGFYFSPPLSSEAFARFFMATRPTHPRLCAALGTSPA